MRAYENRKGEFCVSACTKSLRQLPLASDSFSAQRATTAGSGGCSNRKGESGSLAGPYGRGPHLLPKALILDSFSVLAEMHAAIHQRMTVPRRCCEPLTKAGRDGESQRTRLNARGLASSRGCDENILRLGDGNGGPPGAANSCGSRPIISAICIRTAGLAAAATPTRPKRPRSPRSPALIAHFWAHAWQCLERVRSVARMCGRCLTWKPRRASADEHVYGTVGATVECNTNMRSRARWRGQRALIGLRSEDSVSQSCSEWRCMNTNTSEKLLTCPSLCLSMA